MAAPRGMSRFQPNLTASRRAPAESYNIASPKIAFRNAALLLLVAIVYYVATKVGFAFTPAERPISTFWPPNALLLATLLLAPRRMWWIFLLAVLPAHLLVQLQTGVPLATAFGWFVGNTTEALIGAFCISYFANQAPLFESVRGVTIFLLFGVLLGPLVTSFLDAAIVLGTGWGNGYWALWSARLFTNMVAELVIVPTVVLFGLNGLSWIRKASPSQYMEAVLLAVGTVAISIFSFGAAGGWRGNTPALLFIPLPFLLWAAVRFGSGGMHASLLTIAVISIWNALHGHDPFTTGTKAESVLTLQIFLCTIAVPLMLLSAFMLELRQSTSKVVEAQEEERHRIARELHDDVCQQLTLVQVELEELRDESASALKPRLGRLYEQVADAFKTTREISHGLHPANLAHIGIDAALRNLCLDIRAEKSLGINFISEKPLPRLPENISLCLYRVAQTALQNVVKHSHAQSATVTLTVNRERVSLHIVDDGVGFVVEHHPTTGLGLASMRERVRLVGGKIEVISAPMRGTTIEASLPLREVNVPRPV
ncbi:MAG TPA: MASE1 domain-containing protein [Candidatus Acidoferrum sp.]|nr:MASE1 domain-containing protein [Candidatus Acidoferrum sp.]